MLLGFGLGEVAVLVVVSMLLCALATSLAMETIALYLPAVLLLFPAVLPNFPAVGTNDAIGLALVVMFFGQTSTLSGYWYRGQVDRRLAAAALSITVPLAVAGRVGSFFLPGEALLAVFAVLLFGLAAVVARYHGEASAASDRSLADDEPAAGDGGTVVLDRTDRLVYAVGGLLGGGLGFATGELSNTTLTIRNGVDVSLSTGTSTLVLYLTVLTANVTNLVVINYVPLGNAGGVAVPWRVAAIAAPAFLVGGQLGSLLNDRLSSGAIVRLLVGSYVLVGVVTLARLAL